MSPVGDYPTGKADNSAYEQYKDALDREPVDYAFLEEHLDELDLTPTRCETMEEEYHRQGAEMLRFREFKQNLDEGQQELSDRERFRLFLKQEGRHDREQRRMYLLLLRYERQWAEGKFEG